MMSFCTRKKVKSGIESNYFYAICYTRLDINLLELNRICQLGKFDCANHLSLLAFVII